MVVNHDHVWVQMGWQEAYPASNGIKCSLEGCDAYRLGWFANADRRVQSDAPEFANETG